MFFVPLLFVLLEDAPFSFTLSLCVEQILENLRALGIEFAVLKLQVFNVISKLQFQRPQFCHLLRNQFTAPKLGEVQAVVGLVEFALQFFLTPFPLLSIPADVVPCLP